MCNSIETETKAFAIPIYSGCYHMNPDAAMQNQRMINLYSSNT